MGLLSNPTPKIVTCIILQRTSTNTNLKVAELENIRTNHLRFVKSLFQHYCQHLRLNHNYISTESAFNFYVNKRIAYLLETPVNIESAREVFYSKLIQNTNLPTNYNFASIITEINKEIEHHIQQRYPITYVSKGKGKLQTPAELSEKEEQEEEKEESEDQEFTYQNPILENPEFETPNNQTSRNPNQKNPKIETLNIRTPLNQDNQNSEQNLQPLQQPIHQPQQPLQPPIQQQQLNLDPMVYTPIAKIDNFTSEENNAQVWLNDIEKTIAVNGWNDARAIQAIPYFLKNTADLWYQSLVAKPQIFNDFKTKFVRYFSNNNSINCLTNTFTTIKQEDTEAVTTYLECFYRNLHQIQAIQADYFMAPQILNQFIRGLCSIDLPTAVIQARDFEAAELEANHTQAVNLVMNGSFDLDSKLKQISDSINQKIERYLADNQTIYQPPTMIQ
ncbi:hypothetical protein G9A89_003728 [Geosiphon pyriformis]|nr:hypothetical protein G9A89_003728 [Geosiphon pyriformis]